MFSAACSGIQRFDNSIHIAIVWKKRAAELQRLWWRKNTIFQIENRHQQEGMPAQPTRPTHPCEPKPQPMSRSMELPRCSWHILPRCRRHIFTEGPLSGEMSTPSWEERPRHRGRSIHRDMVLSLGFARGAVRVGCAGTPSWRQGSLHEDYRSKKIGQNKHDVWNLKENAYQSIKLFEKYFYIIQKNIDNIFAFCHAQKLKTHFLKIEKVISEMVAAWAPLFSANFERNKNLFCTWADVARFELATRRGANATHSTNPSTRILLTPWMFNVGMALHAFYQTSKILKFPKEKRVLMKLFY